VLLELHFDEQGRIAEASIDELWMQNWSHGRPQERGSVESAIVVFRSEANVCGQVR
jgi:hypothetical protein